MNGYIIFHHMGMPQFVNQPSSDEFLCSLQFFVIGDIAEILYSSSVSMSISLAYIPRMNLLDQRFALSNL